MGKSLQSEVGEMLQKWVHYHLIPDHTEFWFSWDPSDPEDFRLLQKYEENDGSIAYLPNNLAKNLVSLWVALGPSSLTLYGTNIFGFLELRPPP